MRGNPAAISVVIVNWNGGAHLDACLDALARQTRRADRIVIVDNGSTDGSDAGLERRHPGALVIRTGRNLGFAAACNIGARAAEGCEWMALINPDAVPADDWLERLIAASERAPGTAMFASHILIAGEEDVIDGTGDVYHVSGMAWRRHHRARAADVPALSPAVFAPCAAAALYKRDVFLDAGGFDEDFFCYFEDVDLGFRLRLAGVSALYVPEARAHHVVSASAVVGSAFYVYYGQRNMIWTYVKNMPGALFWRYLPQHVLANVLGVVWFSARGLGPTVLRAKWDAVRGLPAAWRKRRDVQARRRVGAAGVAAVLTRGWRVPYASHPRRF